MNYYDKYMKYKFKYNKLLMHQGGSQSEELQYRSFLNLILKTEINAECFEIMKQKLISHWKQNPDNAIRNPDRYISYYKRLCLKQVSDRDKHAEEKRAKTIEAKRKLIEQNTKQLAEKAEFEKSERLRIRAARDEDEARAIERTIELSTIRRQTDERLAHEKKLAGGEGIIFAHGNTVKDRFCIIPENLTLRPTVKCFFTSPRENYIKNKLIIEMYGEFIENIKKYGDPIFQEKLVINKLDEDETILFRDLIEQLNKSPEKYVKSEYLKKYSKYLEELKKIDEEISLIKMQLSEIVGKSFDLITNPELNTIITLLKDVDPEKEAFLIKFLTILVELYESKDIKETFIKLFNNILKDREFLLSLYRESEQLEIEVKILQREESYIKPLKKRQTREQIKTFAYGDDLSLKYENIYESGSIIPDMKLVFNPTYPIMGEKGAYSFTGIVTNDLVLEDDRLIMHFKETGSRLKSDPKLQEQIKLKSLLYHDEKIITKDDIYMGPPNYTNSMGRDFFYLSEVLKMISDYKFRMDSRPETDRIQFPFPSTFILQSCRGAEDLDPSLILEDCHDEEKGVAEAMSNPRGPIERVSSFSDTENPFIKHFKNIINNFFDSRKQDALSAINQEKIIKYLQSKADILPRISEIMSKIESYIKIRLIEIKKIIDRENYISNEDFCFIVSIIKDDLNTNLLEKIIYKAIN